MSTSNSFTAFGVKLILLGGLLLLKDIILFTSAFQTTPSSYSTPSSSSSSSTAIKTTTGVNVAFLPRKQHPTIGLLSSSTTSSSSKLHMSSFASDGSEYGSKDTDYEEDDTVSMNDFGGPMSSSDDEGGRRFSAGGVEEDSVPTVELQPVPMSKNSGNRFVAIVYDQELDTKNRDVLDLHDDRDELIEDHVMFCRKRNLYNETFNTESNVDILWSMQTLSSDLKRAIGHVLFMETKETNHIYDLLREEPILQSLLGEGTNNDVDHVPLYRWRHIRDYTLRHDDGRFGYPCMLLAMDDDGDDIGGDVSTSSSALRETLRDEFLEYLIKSERVIAAGPLHLPTEYKDDPSSLAVGDLIMFNAKSRADAIEFVENLPTAMEGLYKDMRIHFYNSLDVTGKFVSEDPMRDAPCHQMKEALEYWGYPVDDEQTPWLNW